MAPPEALTLSAPYIDLHAERTKWEREYEAFQRLLPGLLQTHEGEYVVIHEGRVADRGPDELPLALRFLAQHGNIPIHIGLVTDQPDPILRVPHYRQSSRAGVAE